QGATAFATRIEMTAGVVSASLAAQAEGVLRTMFLSQLKVAALIVFAGGLLVCGVGAFSGKAQEGNATIFPREGSNALSALKNARGEAAKTRLRIQENEFKGGVGTLDRIASTSKYLMETEGD